MIAKVRQITAQPPVLGDRRAEGVDHQAGLLADRLHQADRPEEPRRIEFEGIRGRARHAAHDQIDGVETVQGLQEHATVLGPEIRALHQKVPEIAREIGVAEEVAVMRPGG